MKKKCYDCKFRGEVLGSVHTRCLHPEAKTATANNPLGEIMAIFASVGRAPAVVAPPKSLNIRGNAHGIARGWFNWPYNFDPVWLENCDGFTEKEKS